MSVKVKNFLAYDYKIRVTIFFLVVFSLVFSLFFLKEYFRPHLLKVSFYNVGQGDSIFIETPDRYQVLIDGGRGPKVLEEIANDMPFYDRTIDLVIPTHPDSDHVAGLVDILERYEVKNILIPRIQGNTVVFKRLLEGIEHEGAHVREAMRQEGFQKITLPGNVRFEILNPSQGETYENNNDSSTVSLFSYGLVDVLLLADVSAKKEEKLIPLIPKGIEILKIAHHGAKSSLNFNFLKVVSSQLSVISVGENNYGHPSPEVLKTLEALGSKIWRTDEQGTLTILSDGKTYWVK